jgi:hypothetical protein
MTKKCPSCKSANVRRSSTPEPEVTWRNGVFSRYRCRDCMLQFWVIGRKTYLTATAIVAAIAVIVLAIVVLEMLASLGGSSSGRQRGSKGLQQEHVLFAAEIPLDGVASVALWTRHPP